MPRKDSFMKLIELLNDAAAQMPAKIRIADKNAEVSGITDNTENVTENSVFICVKGTHFDGHNAAAEMIEKGALCVVAQRDTGVKNQVIVSDTRAFYGCMCAAWFHHPEKNMRLVGVTGTNGKTTMATLIKHVLSSNGHKVGFIGTTGALINDKPVKSDGSTPTTPRVWELYKLFSDMAAAGCDTVVMEVSSFALEQNRIGPAVFDVGVFTNLTQDHLDYHITMENYFNAKKLLFTKHCRTAVINVDDPYGKKLYTELKSSVLNKNGLMGELISYGLHDGADIHGDNIRAAESTTKFWISILNKSFPVELSMLGIYNVSNTIAAIIASLKCGIGIYDVISSIGKFRGVRGRCEILTSAHGFMVICDYAHSPDALENMLPNIREHTKGRLICLFGCGGDRDKTKRPLMAAAAEKYSDMLVITSDNPRSEEPERIIDDIIAGLNGTKPYIRIADRRTAIECAIMLAEKGDTIVLAGKGHEDYQILKDDVHIHFDEREIVEEIMKSYRKTLFDPNKREYLTLNEIAEAVGGKLLRADGTIKIAADAIFSDTRKIIGGGLFVAIKGEKFDGNNFAANAVKSGAAAALTERSIADCPCILVKSTRKALLELAHHFRMKFDPIVVGVTGSVGKTTTKTMVSLALSGSCGVMKTEGNRNNEIGLPFTLFRLNSTCSAAVVEMGMSDFGEIARLSTAAAPTICLITNIGVCHIEKLGSQEGILEAKTEILKGAKKGAPLIVNGDDKLLLGLKSSLPEHHDTRRVITYGIENTDADYVASEIIKADGRMSFVIVHNGTELVNIELNCLGKHNIYNALAAIAVASEAGANVRIAAKMLCCYKGDSLRQNVCRIGGQTVIKDCYNASPTSMQAALDMLCEIETRNGGRRVAVFGDMLELGEDSPRYHSEVGEYAARKHIDLLICYGELSAKAASRAGALGINTFYSADKSEIIDFMRSEIKTEDVILYKASRGMKMEEIISEFYDKKA